MGEDDVIHNGGRDDAIQMNICFNSVSNFVEVEFHSAIIRFCACVYAYTVRLQCACVFVCACTHVCLCTWPSG